MRNKTVNNTVKEDLCIGCGICKVVCKHNAITICRNDYGETIPRIDKLKCNNCGVCLRYCPNSLDKFKSEAEKITSIVEPHTFGLQNSSYYVAWDSDKIQRLKCCSGGAVTKLASYLYELGIIDGMIHVERLWGKLQDLHYGARLSKSLNEIQENVSSAYQPVNFDEILLKLEKGKTYFMTGTPCVIRGMKFLFENNRDFYDINIITCALICSHNTNSQIIDYLAENNNIYNKDIDWQVNTRAKDTLNIDANNYKNHIYTKDNIDLLNKNRFESGWTHIWRNHYFAMGACLKCSDFWGYNADISVKDAWGSWAQDPMGKSIVIIRNTEIERYFLNSGIIYENIDWNTIKDHQYLTPLFKQTQAYDKNFKSILSKTNRKNGLFKYLFISKISKYLYKNLGFKLTKFIMPFVEKIANMGEKF